MCDLTHMCDMVRSCVATAHLCAWHKSFKRVQWQTLAWRRIVNNARRTYRDRANNIDTSMKNWICSTLVRRIHMCHMILNMVHSHVWRDFFRGSMAHMCDVNSRCGVTRSHVCHDRLLHEVVHLFWFDTPRLYAPFNCLKISILLQDRPINLPQRKRFTFSTLFSFAAYLCYLLVRWSLFSNIYIYIYVCIIYI